MTKSECQKKAKTLNLAIQSVNELSFRETEAVLGAGLEPACLSAYAPQTYVSAIPPPERALGRIENGRWEMESRKRFRPGQEPLSFKDSHLRGGYGAASRVHDLVFGVRFFPSCSCSRFCRGILSLA